MDFFDLREQKGKEIDELIKNYFENKGYKVVYREQEDGTVILLGYEEVFFIKKLTIERGEYFMGANGFSWEIYIKKDRKRELLMRIATDSKNEDNNFVYHICCTSIKDLIKEQYDNFEDILNLITK
ncbi:MULTISPECIES: hypothetical protein [Clostridium]|uniref:hypothetical protein n=1 Tax=Clostridium TaxID=1485 RepID=UPI0018A8DE52|nr:MULTISPECIES: hypothetical protein [Clostridium]MDU1069910.1 hypothetical protein [Clostridium sp.]MDU2677785.1 hypothetical protein [Clostridium sp.]MDU4213811.1 hypothetical protein [Clostridium sp.]MDU5173771.1 hypothetical protein [Clostridium sp.]MDU7120682.1 hypothetical protein [Clostridium sp.]